MSDADVTPPHRRSGLWGAPWGVVAWAVAALAILGALYGAAATGALTWSMAVDAREAAVAFVARHPVLAHAAYLALFVAMAVALFPAQLWIIVFGALVFGLWPALIASWIAAVISSLVVFLLARGVLKRRYTQRTGRYLARVEAAFLRDQFSWMLAMRFFPALPYCVSNVAPAILGASLPPFFIAAAIGVAPYIAVYTFAGDRAAAMLNRDAPPDMGSLAGDLAPIMVAVAALPLASLAVRRFTRRKPDPASQRRQ